VTGQPRRVGLASVDPNPTAARWSDRHGPRRLLLPIVAMEANAGPARELLRLKTQVEAAPVMAQAMS
jgi:hypothetical protein